ncbi:MAG: hypothetical protein HKN12_08975 [Gemmatimonadetes bacterium]|nr:hypothetical protein [Gemmatimonadota bacterium]
MKPVATILSVAALAVVFIVPADALETPSHDFEGAGISAVASGPFPATLPDIQAQVLTPSCALSFCHGAGMAGGMNLEDGNSYSNLVGAPSLVNPGATRVIPFDPDNSFLICKLEACPTIVGSQMPLIGGPLGQDVIDVIRTWILIGAPETPPVSVDPESWGRVKSSYR